MGTGRGLGVLFCVQVLPLGCLADGGGGLRNEHHAPIRQRDLLEQAKEVRFVCAWVSVVLVGQKLKARER